MAQLFNACEYLLDRRLADGDGQRLALTGVGRGPDLRRSCTTRSAGPPPGCAALGLQPEQRVLMLMADSPQFVVVYLAAMRMGAIPVPVSTMLHADGVADLLNDSRARLLAITREFAGTAVEAATAAPRAAGDPAPDEAPAAAPVPVHLLGALAAGPFAETVYPTIADSPAFWLYTSGTTGLPKAAMHRHGAIQVVCETYGTQVLGIRPDDRCLSAAKAFFAYGLGNSLLFPLSVGAAGGARTEPVAARRHRRRRAEVRRDAVLRRPDVLREHAAGRTAGRRAGRGPAGRLGRGGAAGRAVHAVDVTLRRRTSWTASA